VTDAAVHGYNFVTNRDVGLFRNDERIDYKLRGSFDK